MAGALDDLRVVELAEGWAAPLCGRLLADLGAEVIKVESPQGDPLRHRGPFKDGLSYAFELVSAGKESVVVDLSREDGHQSLRRLIADADVFLHSKYESALARLGLSTEDMGQVNPGLITCSLTPFGQHGPLAGWAGSELTVQAVGGIMATTGYHGGPPMRAAVRMVESAAAFFSATAILAALYYRDRTGLGQSIDMALHDAAIAFMANWGGAYFIRGRVPIRDGNRHVANYPWNSYPAQDGYVFICIGTSTTQWPELLRVIGREDLLGDERYETVAARRQRADEVDEIVSEWTMSRTVAEVIATLEKHRLVAGPICDVAQVIEDPHFQARGLLVEVERPRVGRVPTSGSLFKLSGTPGHVAGPAPALGAHTEEILSRSQRQGKRVSPGQATPQKALEGIRSVELTLGTTGSYTGKTLATLGSEELKVEPPGGDRTRSHALRIDGLSYVMSFVNHTDKKSITLNTESESGQEILRRLVASADIFIDNFVPGRLEGMGLGYEALRQLNPRLIYAAISGFGRGGPYSHKRAYDTMIQAMAGILSVTGDPDGLPLRGGVSVADVITATFAPIPILAALHHRQRTGQGQFIDIAMYDVTTSLAQEVWPIYLATGKPPGRVGNRHLLLAPHNVYAARDGLIAIAVETDEQWQRLAEAIGRPELAEHPAYQTSERRLAAVDELDTIVGEWVMELSADQAVAACQRLGVPAAPVLELDQVLSHPHAREREMVIELADPSGNVRATTFGSPLKLSRTPGSVARALGEAGEFNQEVYSQLGYNEKALEQLKEAKII